MRVFVAVCILLMGSTAIKAQCAGGGCQVGGYYSGPVYYDAPVYYGNTYSNTLSYTIVNQGVEKSRFYIKAKVHGRIYSVPVINGNMPQITVRGNDLYLNYQHRISYSNEYGGEYVVYQTITNDENQVSEKTINQPRAVKSVDAPQKSIKKDVPSGVKTPTDAETKVDAKVDVKPSVKKGVAAPSDKEIDDLLKRPSSIAPTKTKVLPRY